MSGMPTYPNIATGQVTLVTGTPVQLSADTEMLDGGHWILRVTNANAFYNNSNAVTVNNGGLIAYTDTAPLDLDYRGPLWVTGTTGSTLYYTRIW